MSTFAGLGRKSQDWSYLTPIRALYTQTAENETPLEVPDYAIIDTTKYRDGTPTERARNQTLVIYAIPRPGFAGFDTDKARLYLWKKCEWANLICRNDGNESSSSQWGCDNIPDWNAIPEINQWALIDAAQHTKLANNTDDRSVAFSFPWLPAGLYKAAITKSGSIVAPGVVIAEQHTE